MNRTTMVTASLLAVLWPALGTAQEHYPARPITLVVPFPPGGVGDLVGRPLAASMEKTLKQSVVVTNRSGAAGAVGNAAVANAKPDGYTVLAAITSVSIIPEADKLFNRPPAYTLNQLAPVALVSADPVFVVVHSSLPVKSIKELVQLAKSKPNQISYSSSGIYGALHVPTEMFAHAAGIKMRHVPTTGGGPALTTLLGGHVELSTGGTAAIEAHVKSGRLRALAGTGAKRHPGMPDVPTLKELGYDVEYYLWWGMMTPAGMPEAASRTLRDAVRQASADGDFKNAMAKLNTGIQYLDAPEFQKFLDTDAARMAAAVKAIGKVDDKK